MEKKRLKKLVINRETLRELSVEEARRVVGGDGGGSAAEESCVADCARLVQGRASALSAEHLSVPSQVVPQFPAGLPPLRRRGRQGRLKRLGNVAEVAVGRLLEPRARERC